MSELAVPLPEYPDLPLLQLLGKSARQKRTNGEANRLDSADRAAHGWYRFVLSFPPHLVRYYLHRFGAGADTICLDPFCGTGTTLVECKKLGIASIGVEPHPMSFFAASVKVDWAPDPHGLLAHAEDVADRALRELRRDGISDSGNDLKNVTCDLRKLAPEAESLLLANSISPLPLHKSLVLLEKISQGGDNQYIRHELLALAQALVSDIGNLHFGPEVGLGAVKSDAPVVDLWLRRVRAISADLVLLRAGRHAISTAIQADSRALIDAIPPKSVTAVITSPPYPNEKDYTRTTRLESVLLGLLKTKAELKNIKRGLMRSNTRNVYKGDDDDAWISEHAGIRDIAEAIECRRVALGKTSGFEKMYAKVTKLYFGGMAKHLHQLRAVLRPGAQLAYVVGDQASYLRVMIRTGQLLAEIAKTQGYDVLGIDLFRTRFSTATGEHLREEAVLLRWPG